MTDACLDESIDGLHTNNLQYTWLTVTANDHGTSISRTLTVQNVPERDPDTNVPWFTMFNVYWVAYNGVRDHVEHY